MRLRFVAPTLREFQQTVRHPRLFLDSGQMRIPGIYHVRTKVEIRQILMKACNFEQIWTKLRV